MLASGNQHSRAAAVSEGRVFHTLDALRGIAAIGVVTFHMKAVFAPFVASGGYLAVDLFFMMSGAVLSYAYEARFKAGMGTIDFMRARLIRLYPLYLMGTLLGIGVTVASLLGRNINNWSSWSLMQAVVLALVFLPNLSGRPVNQIFPLNVPCWSLFFELLVNLLYVVFWSRLTSRRLIVLSLLTGGAIAFAIGQNGSMDQGSTAASFAIGLARTIFGFAVGVLIARHLRPAPRVESDLWVLGILAVVGVAIAANPEGELRVIWDAVCVLVVFPLVVCLGTRFDPSLRLRSVASVLGITSYAIYVLHSPVSSGLNSITRHYAGGAIEGVGAPYLGGALLAVLFTGCWVIDRYFDMPIRTLLSRIVPKVQAARAQ